MVQSTLRRTLIYGLIIGVRAVRVHRIFILHIIVEFLKNIIMGSIVSAVVNRDIAEDTNATNRQIARETNEANMKLAAQQNEWNREAKADERAYNDPSKQVERLRNAGLSDAASVQSIEGAGNTTALQSADLANQQVGNPMQPYTLDLSSIGSNVLGLMRQYIAMKKESADAKKAESEANIWDDMLLTDYDLKQSEISSKRQNIMNTYYSFPYSLNALKYESEAAKFLPKQRQAEFDKLKSDKELVDWNVKRTRQAFDWTEKLNDKQIEKLSEEIKNVVKQRQVMSSQIGVNKAREKEIGESTENVVEQRKGITAESQRKELETILIKYGSPESTAERVAALLVEGKLKSENVAKSLDSLRDYVRDGNKWLGDDPYTRDFLYYYWDEGKRRAATSGFWSQGFFQEMLDAIFNQRPHK